MKKKEPSEANAPERLLHVVSVYILETVTGPQDRTERAVHVRLGKFVAALVVQAELAIKQQFGANRQFQVRKGRDVEIRAARIAGLFHVPLPGDAAVVGQTIEMCIRDRRTGAG